MSLVSDTHGNFTRFISHKDEYTENTGVIILGDAGTNYYLDSRDRKLKKALCRDYRCTFYLVRGNHEARPQDIPGMERIFDPNVSGEVYYEPQYPNIKYFLDYGDYTIHQDEEVFSFLVIGGAYSVDKYYRIQNGWNWFENEQLNDQEKEDCLRLVDNKTYDFVFTHTCPIDWMPRDLFLPSIDQSTVDNSMEEFLREVREKINYRVWVYGHYHADRLTRPGVIMMFPKIVSLSEINEFWEPTK